MPAVTSLNDTKPAPRLTQCRENPECRWPSEAMGAKHGDRLASTVIGLNYVMFELAGGG